MQRFSMTCDKYCIFSGRSFHLLTSNQPYRLRMEMREESTGLWYSVEYWTFQIGGVLDVPDR